MEQQISKLITELSALLAGYTVLIICFGIILIFLKSYGIYKVGKSSGCRFLLLAWVPIMKYHVVAQIADKYRVSVGKEQKLTTDFEIITTSFIVVLIAASQTGFSMLFLLYLILVPALAMVTLFSDYYFFKLCDKENATIYFILSLGNAIMNAIFFYHCRNKCNNRYYSIYR